MKISSPRLDLIPLTPAFLQASIERDPIASGEIIGASIPADWPDFPDYVLELRLGQLRSDPSLEPWLLRAIVLRSERAMIGSIGFHGPPGDPFLEAISPGAAEFGFGVFPGYRRQGFAREAAQALMAWARSNHGVRNFIMTISPGNTESQALAAQLGFVRIGSHEDEMDGAEDILELKEK